MGKTTLNEKIGYGIASLGDATGYMLIGVFLLFFLTTIAGISPGIAGTIAAIGSVWNALVNPIIGYFADKVHSKFGRRRTVMLIFSIPLLLSMVLLFTNVAIPMSVKPVYYGLLVMLYWISYTGFIIPYLALGAEYTADYDDRTALRLWGSFFNTIGSMLAMVLPTMIVDFFHGLGMSLSKAWSLTALILAVFTFLSIVITVAAAKHKDIAGVEPSGEERLPLKKEIGKIFREYISIAKLKPMKPLIAASLCALIGHTLIMSNLVYLLTYNMGLSATEISGSMLLRVVFSTLLIPIVAKLISVADRREALMGFYLLGSIGMCLIRFISLPQTAELWGYLLLVVICTSTYWQIIPGVFYDVCEYDRIKNGRNRSATILSFQGLVEAIAAGIGGQLLGLILEVAGFDGEAAVQSASAQLWIAHSGTVIPVVFLVLSAAALYKYPLSRKVYNELLESERR